KNEIEIQNTRSKGTPINPIIFVVKNKIHKQKDDEKKKDDIVDVDSETEKPTSNTVNINSASPQETSSNPTIPSNPENGSTSQTLDRTQSISKQSSLIMHEH